MDWYQDFLLKYNNTLAEISGQKKSSSLINDGVFQMDSSSMRSDIEKFDNAFKTGGKLPLSKLDQMQENALDKQFPNRAKTGIGDNITYSILNSKQRPDIMAGSVVDKNFDNKTYFEKMKQYLTNIEMKKMYGSKNEGKTNITEGQLNNQISTTLTGNDLTNQPNDFFTKVFGMNKDQMMQSWKDKGGFDALMSNPAFLIGLSFLQSSAQGKTISESALNNILKGGGIAGTYKKLLADKTEVIQPTEGDLNKIKSVLNTSFDISAPILRKLLPGNQAEKYEQAVEDIALAVNKKVRAAVKTAKSKGQDLPITDRLYKKIIQEMINNKEIDKKGGFKLFGYNIIDATLEAQPLEHGGTAHKGETYLVGEKGPEVFIPKETGEVVANDDSQVFTMLLAANPQLQKISKERAMKILKAKFPEYFD